MKKIYLLFITIILIFPVVKAQSPKPPYPIIFVHGLVGDDLSFKETLFFLRDNFHWGCDNDVLYAFDVVLNADNNEHTSIINTDVKWEDFVYNGSTITVGRRNLVENKDDFSSGWWDKSARLFAINFAEERIRGAWGTFNDLFDWSNEAAIMKQGKALGEMIKQVLQFTQCEKVILVGHSMGGLAIREYLQRTNNNDKTSDHRWWVEPDNLTGHKVAKVVTIGTPHLGSNFLEWLPILKKNSTPKARSGFLPNLHSEAVRDLRYNYFAGNLSGLYLFGGSESVVDLLTFGFHNLDVNCDGNENGYIVGINEAGDGKKDNPNMPLPLNIQYLWITSVYNNRSDDFIVDINRQWLHNEYYESMPLNISDTLLTHDFHSDEGGDYVQIIRGLDEPKDYQLAYHVDKNVYYSGLITTQTNNESQDKDVYKFNLTIASKVKVTITGRYSGVEELSIEDEQHTLLNSATITTFPFTLECEAKAGDHFLIINGTAKGETWRNPYQYKIETTPIDLVVDFQTDVTSGIAPLTVKFTDISLGAITKREWDFNNDGIIDSYQQNPVYTYSEPGVYSVRLTVYYDTNSKTVLKERLITVSRNVITTKLAEAEYYFDIDPGIGFAKKITLANVSNYIFDTKLDVASLNEGIHVFGFRVKDENGKWSFTYNKLFLKERFSNNYNKLISKLEYYIDQDPGYDFAISVPVITASNIEKNFSADIVNVNKGIHTLFLRAKDNLNVWSNLYSKIFIKETFSSTKTLKRLEYFIDNDPGIGLGISIGNVSSEKDSVSFFADLKNISSGVHIFYCRAQDSENKWSILYSKLFLIDNKSQGRSITELEYFFDSDPGYGNGNKVSVLPSGELVIQFNADVKMLTTEKHNLFVRVKDNEGVWSFVTGKEFDKIAEKITAQLKLKAGWNMVSVPLKLEDLSVQSILPSALTKLYSFSEKYDTTSFFSKGQGYFIKLPNSVSKEISGSNYSDRRIPLEKQWNIIGIFENNIPVDRIKTSPAGIISSFFFGYDEGYYRADTLKTGQAYWIMASDQGVIDSALVLGKNNWFAKELNLDGAVEGNIEIVDSKGRKKLLLVTKNACILEHSIIPPVPPAGIFDARWSDGRFAADITSSGKELIINSAVYPIIIKVGDVNLRFQDKVDGKLVNKPIRNGESLSISNPFIERLIVMKDVPKNYGLFQNYPNPFNPITKIKFNLPELSKVKLIIYNLLGERVEELINREMEPGYYEIEWNGRKQASGVYLMQLTAGKFSEVKKILLIK